MVRVGSGFNPEGDQALQQIFAFVIKIQKENDVELNESFGFTSQKNRVFGSYIQYNRCDPIVVQLMLDAGIDPNEPNSDGLPPIFQLL